MVRCLGLFLSFLWGAIKNVPEAEVRYGIRKMRAEADYYSRYS